MKNKEALWCCKGQRLSHYLDKESVSHFLMSRTSALISAVQVFFFVEQVGYSSLLLDL